MVDNTQSRISGGNYLIDPKTSQVRLWHLKKLTFRALDVQSFGSDFITWRFPGFFPVGGGNIREDFVRLDLNTLEISGEYDHTFGSPLMARMYVAMAGSCEKTRIPGKKLSLLIDLNIWLVVHAACFCIGFLHKIHFKHP